MSIMKILIVAATLFCAGTSFADDTSDPSASGYFNFDSNVFVAKSLTNLSPETQSNLTPEVPNIKNLGLMIGRAPGETADLYIANFLFMFFMGFPMHANTNELAKVSALPLGEIEKTPEFLQAPAIHQQLLLWILRQPDRSIMPDDLLAKSIEITNGDVLKALILGWDVLSTGWRNEGGMPRDNYPRTKKLAYIPHVTGDLFPSWYHFWGMMTYSYFLSARTFGIPAVAQMYGLLWATLEEIYGLRLWGRPLEAAITRLEIDFAGAKAGAQLFKYTKNLRNKPAETITALNNIVQLKSATYITPQRYALKSGLKALRSEIRSFFKRVFNFVHNPTLKNSELEASEAIEADKDHRDSPNKCANSLREQLYR